MNILVSQILEGLLKTLSFWILSALKNVLIFLLFLLCWVNL
jgi:hypothetical protein